MRALIASLLLLLSSVAHAQTDAYSGIAADAVSSAIASQVPGIAEGGLGLITIPIRLLIVDHAKTLPPEEALPWFHSTSALGWGAAANNVCIALTLNPACLALGALVGGGLWRNGAEERAFYSACASHKRRVAEDAALTCKYTPQT